MYDDVEADFWKEIIVHVQHKNMIRTNATRLYLSDAQTEFEKFASAHPDLPAEITNAATYSTWEVFVTPSIKLRLFIQSQIKGTLLQVQDNDLVKIADMKFPNNPFPDIEEFLSHREEYNAMLAQRKNDALRSNKKLQLAGQFVKAYLKNRLQGTEFLWQLDYAKDGFTLKLQLGNDEKTGAINPATFKEDVEKVISSFEGNC